MGTVLLFIMPKKKQKPTTFDYKSNSKKLDYKVRFKLFDVPLKPECMFHPKRKWRFDFALPCCKIAIEIQGGGWGAGHSRGDVSANDREKFNAAAMLGWRIIYFIPEDIDKNRFLTILREFFYNNPCPHGYTDKLLSDQNGHSPKPNEQQILFSTGTGNAT